MQGEEFMSSENANAWQFPDVSGVFAEDSDKARTIWTLREDEDPATALAAQPGAADWLSSVGFKAKARRSSLLPSSDGSFAGAVFGTGNGEAGVPCGPSALLLGDLARSLPEGDYRLASSQEESAELAAIAWGLGGYDFRRYYSSSDTPGPRLVLPEGASADRVRAIVEGIWFGRDLINTPTSDLGPAEMESAARQLAERHGADIEVTTGDDLLAKNFPMIHAVGRASDSAPRLIDIRWQPKTAGGDLKTVTLVGKGICFDTGGLDLKPAAAMLLMKKDMGGAATALALAHMIMSLELPVRLRVLIPAAENSVAGNAFRPGDVLTSRSGKTVEIGNTDAEGRLVLADALSLADEEEPDTIISLATLTGAARVALGPDLPALFTNDDQFAASLTDHGLAIGDPLWRMPLWKGYASKLSSDIADMNNVSNGPFAGAITAALFLDRFVAKSGRYVHVDLYGWRPSTRPLGRKGGEPHAARALLAAITQEVSS
jgi:leucyl aminopeptidase